MAGDLYIPRLGEALAFPNPREAIDEGLLAFGGDLSPQRLILAYKKGIFPWYGRGDPILWWSPNPRLILFPDRFHPSHSLRKTLRHPPFEITMDRAFKAVMEGCQMIPRAGQRGTWILPEVIEAYSALHVLGYAHSIECWREGVLAGGLYGVSLGGAFFGESMFSRERDASKVALATLVEFCLNRHMDFIDCQVPSEHLIRLGAQTLPRDRFLDALEETLRKPTRLGAWSLFTE